MIFIKIKDKLIAEVCKGPADWALGDDFIKAENFDGSSGDPIDWFDADNKYSMKPESERPLNAEREFELKKPFIEADKINEQNKQTFDWGGNTFKNNKDAITNYNAILTLHTAGLIQYPAVNILRDQDKKFISFQDETELLDFMATAQANYSAPHIKETQRLEALESWYNDPNRTKEGLDSI